MQRSTSILHDNSRVECIWGDAHIGRKSRFAREKSRNVRHLRVYIQRSTSILRDNSRVECISRDAQIGLNPRFARKKTRVLRHLHVHIFSVRVDSARQQPCRTLFAESWAQPYIYIYIYPLGPALYIYISPGGGQPENLILYLKKSSFGGSL